MSESSASPWDFIRGTMAVARLTILEATRQRFWWLTLVAMALLLLIIPGLQAVDDAARLKLAVAAISGTIGFITTLVSVLLVIITVRRDLESRSSFMLFVKPLPRLAYCLGRWLGAVLTLGLAVLLLSIAGAAAITWQLGATPVPQRIVEASHWQVIDHLGALSSIRDDERHLTLGQRPGAGLRLRFDGLVPGEPGQRILIKAMVRGRDGFTPFSWAPVQVAALRSGAESGARDPQLLTVAADSNLGRLDPSGHETAAGQIVLRHRALQRSDLQADYVHLDLPATAIDHGGSLHLQLLRMDSESVITIPREGGIMVTTRGPPFVVDLLKAGLVHLAHAGVLAAVALLLVVIAGVGTSLLGCLTVFFGGHAISVVSEVSQSPQTSLLARRVIDLITPLVPDFGRFPVAAELAAAHSIPLSTIAAAWLYFGLWMVVMIVLGWLVLTRKEL